MIEINVTATDRPYDKLRVTRISQEDVELTVVRHAGIQAFDVFPESIDYSSLASCVVESELGKQHRFEHF